MYTRWTQHLKTEDAKKKFKEQILSSKDVLDHLKTILNEEEKALDRSEIDIRTFDQPNWAERQAFKNGYRASLGLLTKLIDLDQQETNLNER